MIQYDVHNIIIIIVGSRYYNTTDSVAGVDLLILSIQVSTTGRDNAVPRLHVKAWITTDTLPSFIADNDNVNCAYLS